MIASSIFHDRRAFGQGERGGKEGEGRTLLFREAGWEKAKSSSLSTVRGSPGPSPLARLLKRGGHHCLSWRASAPTPGPSAIECFERQQKKGEKRGVHYMAERRSSWQLRKRERSPFSSCPPAVRLQGAKKEKEGKGGHRATSKKPTGAAEPSHLFSRELCVVTEKKGEKTALGGKKAWPRRPRREKGRSVGKAGDGVRSGRGGKEGKKERSLDLAYDDLGGKGGRSTRTSAAVKENAYPDRRCPQPEHRYTRRTFGLTQGGEGEYLRSITGEGRRADLVKGRA